MTTAHEAFGMILDALEAGDVARAGAIGSQIQPQLPDHPDLLQLLAVVAERQGDLATAMTWRRRAIANGAIRQANVLRALGSAGEARVQYEEALKVDLYNPIACNALGAMNQLPTPADPDAQRFGKPPLELFETKLGRYFLPSDAPNDVIALRMKAGQVFEAEVVDALRPYVTQGGSVIDVGANLGQMTLLFSEMVGDAGRVYSIEADEYIYSILCKNINANNRKNIQAINAAAYDRSGNKMFYPVQDFEQFGSYGSYGIEPGATEGREVATITIDSLDVKGRIDLLKVDVQGSDLFAMRGAREIISESKPTIIFEFEQQFQEKFSTSFEQYMGFVESINYRVEKTINGINYLIVPR